MVIKVLEKALTILEFVASRQGHPVLPADIVEALELNQTTCIRLLKDLVENGYLSQISRNKGYVMGPTAVWLGKNSLFRSQLFAVADPILRDASARDGISMLVAVQHGRYRVLICGHNSAKGVQLNMTLPRFPDLFDSATGILLLAYLSPEEVTRQLQYPVKLDHYPWHEGISRDEIDLVLFSIRKNGMFRHHAFGVEACSVPIFHGNKLQAALGGAWRYALPAAQRDAMSENLRGIALEISSALGDGLMTI